MSPTATAKERQWSASANATRALDDAYARLHRARQRALKRYYDDPVAFVYDCIEWPEGQRLAPYQEEVLAALPTKKRVAQRGPHGLGKSTSHALAILWFAFTRDAAGVDWKCPTTAGGWHQLEQYLWPEVHKWAARLRWDKLAHEPFRNGKGLLRLNLQLTFGRAFAVASNVPARIEGAHADSLLFIFDEAKIISAETFDAAEGAFSGTGESMAFCSSTPGEPAGRFYEIHQKKKGLTDWWARHVTLSESVKAGRIRQEWADQRKLLWGEDSALYANRVEGEFHSTTEASILPLPWIEMAIQRWKDHEWAAHLAENDPNYRPIVPMDRVGADIANSGADKTVFALIHGTRVASLKPYVHATTVKNVKNLCEILKANPGATAVVDADGLGVGVADGVRDAGYPVVFFKGAEATEKKDRSGTLEFLNTRAAAWWQLREELDPAYMPTVELPDHDVMLGDLTAPKWSEVGRGKVKVEAKEDIIKRLGRSPDFGDAVVMGRWRPRVKKKRRMTHAGREAAA